MTEADDDTVIDQALEVFVYAPLGFALEARSLLPRFVERGRSQIALARVVGRFAVRKGRDDLGTKLADGQAQAVGLLQLVGLAPSDGESAGDADRPVTTVTPSAGADATDAGGTGHVTADAAPAAGAPTVDPRPAPTPRPRSDIDPERLAIPDYDSLSASQVVPRLESLGTDELELLRQYESGTRGRKTILSRIAQLQSD